MPEDKKTEWHLKIHRAFPGFAKSEIDDYPESRFYNGAEDVIRISKDMTERLKNIRLGEIDNMIYSLELRDAYVSYDMNAVILIIAYTKEK